MAENRDVRIINMTVETEEDFPRLDKNDGNRFFKWGSVAMLGAVVLTSAAIKFTGNDQHENIRDIALAEADIIGYNDCGAAHLLTDYEAGDVFVPTVSRFNPLCFAFSRTIRPEAA